MPTFSNPPQGPQQHHTSSNSRYNCGMAQTSLLVTEQGTTELYTGCQGMPTHKQLMAAGTLEGFQCMS
jgi:hypothetical protein